MASPDLILKNICRACLVEESTIDMHSLLDSPKGIVIAGIYSKYTKLTVSASDGVSPFVCSKCHDLLNDFKKFQEQCISSYDFLLNCVIKNEPNEIEETVIVLEVPMAPDSESSQDYSTDKVADESSSTVEASKSYPLKCKFCQKGFVSSFQYEAHVRKHQGLKPYLCKKCGKEYQSASGIREHMIQHHGATTNEKKYVCDCGLAYAKKVRCLQILP